jgi:thiosulfate/3-mercaptopyruvate sulfurtransferase
MHRKSEFCKQNPKFSLFKLFTQLLLAAILLISLVSLGYGADLALLEAAALKANTAKWVILDARSKEEWAAGHIPGAIQFSWDNYTRTDARGVKFTSFSPRELSVSFARLGIDEKSPILIYGDADKSWGGEGYNAWLFTWLGHKGAIRLLRGGIQAWRSEKLPLLKGAEKPVAPKARYQVALNPQYIVSTEDVQNAKGAYTLIDTRSTLEWLRGKIPGAIHIPWEDFYTGIDRHPLPPADVKKLLAKNGVNTGKPVVFYCLGGVRSAYAWSVYQLADLPDGRNYKGSWAAWEKRTGQ